MCSCDLDLEILCEGNQRLSRCTTKVGSTRQPGVVTPAATRSGGAQNGRGASQLLGTATSTGELQQRELVLIQDLHVIPANHSLKQCEIVVLSHGRWDPALENMPAFTHKGYTSAGQDVEPFPLIPGARWRRSFRGRHAAAVGKDTVVIMFEITMSVSTAEVPRFVARDFEGGVFCKSIASTSMGALEQAWLSQNLAKHDTQISLANMKGGRFMGLDIPALTEYFRSKVPSFQAFRMREKERGSSKEDIGLRQKRRLKASLFEDFEAALGKTCPDGLGRAFELLQSSQAFKTRFLPDIHYRFEKDDKTTQSLVDMYKEAMWKEDKKQAQWVLALYSPFHSQEHTMQLFECSEHACKQANLTLCGIDIVTALWLSQVQGTPAAQNMGQTCTGKNVWPRRNK